MTSINHPSLFGLIEQPLFDNQVHRFHVHGDRQGSVNGWYIAFDGPVPAIMFGSWRTGECHIWRDRDTCHLTKGERTAHDQALKEARQVLRDKQYRRQLAARTKAESIWSQAAQAPTHHPYLIRKRIGVYDIRQSRGSLIVPLYDTSAAIHSLQFIDPDGTKRFLSGGRIKGCFFPIGYAKDDICIAEGYATAASIHETTGHTVVVAFNCGNLKAVALALREKYPQARITVCADNDANTPGNPGLTKASEAAQACGGFLSVPPIVGDFNDWMLVKQND